MIERQEKESRFSSTSYWKQLSRDLNVAVEINTLVPGLEKIGAVSALLSDFGGKHGMIVVEDYDAIEMYVDEILEKGYCFSTVTVDDYCRSDAIEMLQDWGWSSETDVPPWLI
jgi:hypothetical protein